MLLEASTGADSRTPMIGDIDQREQTPLSVFALLPYHCCSLSLCGADAVAATASASPTTAVARINAGKEIAGGI
ncbi:hypothetical protein Dimus_028624, partial [Dionaea muscipula]